MNKIIDDGFTPYFLEKVSELPERRNDNTVATSHTQNQDVVSKQTLQWMNFENSASFPSKLYKMLEDAEKKCFEHIVSWQPDGRSFKVHRVEKFSKEIIPVYFGSIKFKSFQRQLNLYGFTRVHKGVTRGSYTHDLFVRGRKSLSLTISRQKWNPHSSDVASQRSNKDETMLNSGNPPQNIFILKMDNGDSVFDDNQETFTSRSLRELPALHLLGVATPGNGEGSACAGSTMKKDIELDLESICSDSDYSAVEPSTKELSYLFDCDDKTGNLRSLSGATLQQFGTKEVMQYSDFYNIPYGRDENFREVINSNDFSDLSQGLRVVANTLPSACELADDPFGTDDVSDSKQGSASKETSNEGLPVAPASRHLEERSFPWKLHDMLNDAENSGGFQGIISWEPDGMAFKVHDCRLFVDRVMPLYFDQSRYESFRRQLRKYGFSRLDKDRYRGAYHHKYFQKANRHLCKYITRGNPKRKQSSEKKSSDD